MIGFIKDILEVAQGLMGFGESFRQAERARRDRMADYFMAVGTVLNDTAEKLRKGEYPHGSCAQLEVHAKSLVSVVGDEIGQAEAQKWADKLDQAHEIERVHTELEQLPKSNRPAEIAAIDEAAGVFKAMAVNLKATS